MSALSVSLCTQNRHPHIKALFRAYDAAFAEALGLPRHVPKSSYETDYDIEPILSETWWEDAVGNIDKSEDRASEVAEVSA
jgi:hypothetical protein